MTTNQTTANAWLPLWERRADARIRLFCFPYAGGNATVFSAWQQALAPDVEVCAVEYPGRWRRLREPPIANLNLLVEKTLEGLGGLFNSRFAFFGHSLGSLVAFELTRTLRRRGRTGPEHLFVSARPAPQRPTARPPIHHLPQEQFIVEVGKRYRALPTELQTDPELLALLLPALRADIAAVETHVYKDEPPLSCPITAFAGSDDSLMNSDDLTDWRLQTSAAFASYQMPGDHFFVNTCAARVMPIVRAALGELGAANP
jgi:medium-chain acyl-[acyl-carrier-protein] hydrolase